MTTISQFSVSPRSRHPKHFPLAYNKVMHKYSDTYINPKVWGIRISLDLARERDEMQMEADTILIVPNSSLFKKLKEKKDKLLKQVNEINAVLHENEVRFNVKKTNGTFSKDTVVNDYHPTINVPSVGTYTITIKVKNKAGQDSTTTQNITFQDILIVSLGDSYAAGEGNPDEKGEPTNPMETYANRPTVLKLAEMKLDMKRIGPNETIPNVSPDLRFANWQEPMAHRSYRSGHSLAAVRVEGKYQNVNIVATYLPFSRSGATIDKGLVGPNTYKYHPERRLKLGPLAIGEREEVAPIGSLDFRLKIGQLDEAKKAIESRRVDFLVMTIGGNNVKWQENFPLLIMKDTELFWEHNPFNHEAGDDEGYSQLILETTRLLETIPQKFEQLNTKIRQTLNPRFVLITEYPNGFFGYKDSQGNMITKSDCDIFKTLFDADIDNKDAHLIRDLAEKLNNVIKKSAEKHGWIFVNGITDDFAEHGYCSSDPYFVHTSESFLGQGDWYGMLHPNNKGHDAYGRRISDKINKVIQENLSAFTPGV